MTQPSSGIRRAEIIAALSLATDLALGQPMEHALRACVLAMRLGEALGLSDEDLGAVYWSALLRHVGCNAETHSVAAIFGDEIAFNREVTKIEPRFLLRRETNREGDHAKHGGGGGRAASPQVVPVWLPVVRRMPSFAGP